MNKKTDPVFLPTEAPQKDSPPAEGPQKDIQQLALDILTLSRNLLLIRLRFLEPAFLQLSLLPDPEGSFATDGSYIYYIFLPCDPPVPDEAGAGVL